MLTRAVASSYERNDPHFARDLAASQPSLWVAARWIHRKLNCDVIVRRMPLRKAVTEIDSFEDPGDLGIIRNGKEQRVEVKRRKFEFSSAATYPFDTAIVDNQHKWDRATDKPVAFVILDKTMKHLAVARAETAPHWVRQTVFDKAKGRERHVYLCPTNLMRFYAVAGPYLQETP